MNVLYKTGIIAASCLLIINNSHAMQPQSKLEIDPRKAMRLGMDAISQISGPNTSQEPTLEQWVTGLRGQQLVVSCKVKDLLRDLVSVYNLILDGIARKDLDEVEDGRRSFLILRGASRGTELKLANPAASWFLCRTCLEPKEAPFRAALQKATDQVLKEQRITQAKIDQFSEGERWRYNCDLLSKCLPALETECKLRLALEEKALEEISKFVTDADEKQLADALVVAKK